MYVNIQAAGIFSFLPPDQLC